MDGQRIIFLTPYLVSLAISTGIGLYAWRRREVPEAGPYAIYALSQAAWTAGYLCELIAPSLQAKVFWDNFQWAPSFLVPLALLAFVLRYSGRTPAYPRRTWGLLALFPILFLLLAYTNPLHHLVQIQPQLDSGEIFSLLVYDFGPVVWAAAAYSYGVILVAIWMLLSQFARSHRIYRAQVGTIIAGILLPLVGSVPSLLGITFTFQGSVLRDVTPFTFAIGNLVVAWGLFRYRLLNIVPVARDRLIESMADAVVVVDAQNRVVDVNPAACRALGRAAGDVVGWPVAQVYAEWGGLVERFRDLESPVTTEITVDDGKSQRHYDLRISPLRNQEGRLVGNLIVVHDITERRRAELLLQEQAEALRAARDELEQRTRELQAMYEVLAVASEAQDLQEMLERSLARVLEAMGSSVGLVHLLDEEEGVLHLAAQQGLAGELSTQMAGLAVDPGLVGEVLTGGEPVVVSDVATDRQTLTSYPVPAPIYAGVPMRIAGRIVGVLSVLRQRSQPAFRPEEIALLTSIADQVGAVVESAQLRRRAEHAAVLEERQRLARELHDSVTQSLYSLTLLAETGRRVVQRDELGKVTHYLQRLGGISQQALKEMRLLIYQLRPPELEHEGLDGALQQRLDAVEGRTGVEARLLVEDLPTLSPSVEEALYRVAMEALNNALKHAEATAVTVHIHGRDGTVELEVRDDGRGFEAQAAGPTGGMGLRTMQERVARLEGTMIVESAPGEGTRVRVVVQADAEL